MNNLPITYNFFSLLLLLCIFHSRTLKSLYKVYKRVVKSICLDLFLGWMRRKKKEEEKRHSNESNKKTRREKKMQIPHNLQILERKFSWCVYFTNKMGISTFLFLCLVVFTKTTNSYIHIGKKKIIKNHREGTKRRKSYSG